MHYGSYRKERIIVTHSQQFISRFMVRFVENRSLKVIVGSSAPISPNRNLFSQNQHEIASTGKQIIMVGRPEVLSQSLASFRYRLSVVYQKSLNVSEQNCNVYWSKVWIQMTPKLMRAIYGTSVSLRAIQHGCTLKGSTSNRRKEKYLCCILIWKEQPEETCTRKYLHTFYVFRPCVLWLGVPFNVTHRSYTQ